MDFKTLKANARKSLDGKWRNTVILMLIMIAISVVASSIDSYLGGKLLDPVVYNGVEIKQSLSICTLIVTCLLGFGCASYFLKVSRGESPDFKELFSMTNLFWVYFVITFFIGLFVTLWSLLLIIPGIIAAISYSMALLIRLDNKDMKPLECIKKSKELMKGHKWEYFTLLLSFIGWMILGLFTFGILYFWLVPYMTVTECNYYNELIKTKK